MGNKKCVAYLDVLGFTNYVNGNEHSGFAADILRKVSEVINSKINEESLHPVEKYDETLKPIALRTSITSFENFLSLSDSVFISSGDANLFIKQLSSLLSECFIYTGFAYKNPKDNEHPEKVGIKIDSVNNLEKEEVKWYPVIFRGGVSYDEAIYDYIFNISENEILKSPNIIGKAVVNAVNLEMSKNGKGPKLFIDDKFISQLDVENRRFVTKDSFGNEHFLWPVYHFSFDDVVDNFIAESIEFLQISINLWKGYKDEVFADHYFEFMKLVSNSIVCVCDNYYQKDKERITIRLKSFIKSKDIDLSIFAM